MPHIAGDLGKQAAKFGVDSAYGAPIDVEGAVVTPVALTVSGYAAGGSEEMDGGTAGGIAVPLGVYVRREEGLRFEPNVITLLVVAVPFVWVAGRAITRIIRALKK
ncbi:hypothetical protein [Microbacterium sp.]|uniref:hypothetical protein n=1 Tax=Microbacterium sp. TaxID=51671 RepID=UPI003340F359